MRHNNNANQNLGRHSNHYGDDTELRQKEDVVNQEDENSLVLVNQETGH